MDKKYLNFFVPTILVLLIIVFSYTFLAGLEERLVAQGSLTLFGFDLQESSLLIAAILIGLLDGFNPCAMWVLIYLITLVSQVKERSKMWFIVGTFLLASGILYFVILTGWLNLFEYIGHYQWILWAAGGFAIVMGALAIQDYVKSGGKVECKVGDMKKRKKTMNNMKKIVFSPITIGSVLGTIALAFAVNSIEFVCSAGLPALFTQLLAVADISVATKYMYILIYVLAFMLDDLLIFFLAFKAIDSDFLHKYSGLSKLVGGIIMLIIGVVLIFFPNLLV